MLWWPVTLFVTLVSLLGAQEPDAPDMTVASLVQVTVVAQTGACVPRLTCYSRNKLRTVE